MDARQKLYHAGAVTEVHVMKARLMAFGLGIALCGGAFAQPRPPVTAMFNDVQQRCTLVWLDELEADFQRVRVSESIETGMLDRNTAVCRFTLGDPAAPAGQGNLHVMVTIPPRFKTVADAQVAFDRQRERDKGREYRGVGDDAFYTFCDTGKLSMVCSTVRVFDTIVSVSAYAYEPVSGGNPDDIRAVKVDNRLWRQSLTLASKYAGRMAK